MTKSHVTMEQHCCPVCTKIHDTGAVLLDTRMREMFDAYTVTAWGLCPQCKALDGQGYLALIEAKDNGRRSAKLEEIVRTGRVAHVRRTAWEKITEQPMPDGPFMLITPEAFTALEKLTHEEIPADHTGSPSGA